MSRAAIEAVAGHRDEQYRRELEILAFPGPFRRLGRWLSRQLFKAIFKLYFRMTTRGIENIPATGPVILAMSHASDLDPLVIGASDIRYPKVMAKAELMGIPVLGAWIRLIGGFPVKRGLADRNAINIAIDVLKLGLPFGLFPEGTRSPDGNLQPANPGMAMIACAVDNVPIVPIYIEGTFASLPKGARFPKPAKVTLHIGPPFLVADIPNLPQEKKALYRVVADETMRAIANAKS